jgi:hypothetical protein
MENIYATPDNEDERFMTDENTEDSIIPRDTPSPNVPPIIPTDAESQGINETGAPQASPIIPNDAEVRGEMATDDEDVLEVMIIEGEVLDNGQPVMPANPPVSDYVPPDQAAPTPYEDQGGNPTPAPTDTGQPVMPTYPQVPSYAPVPDTNQMPGSTAMRVGMPVVDINGVPVGQVKAVNERGILVNRPMQRDLTVPMNALSMLGNQVMLSISAAQAENLGWDQLSAL